jgi:hypothetical protein
VVVGLSGWTRLRGALALAPFAVSVLCAEQRSTAAFLAVLGLMGLFVVLVLIHPRVRLIRSLWLRGAWALSIYVDTAVMTWVGVRQCTGAVEATAAAWVAVLLLGIAGRGYDASAGLHTDGRARRDEENPTLGTDAQRRHESL